LPSLRRPATIPEWVDGDEEMKMAIAERSDGDASMGARPPAPWPRHVILEITNACDLKCRGCHFHAEEIEKLRPVRQMPRSMWLPAIAEIAGWGTPVQIQPWGMGEPLLHPDLWEIVDTASRHPQVKVGFYSNGMQWRADDIERAVGGGLDWLCISVDGLRRDVFEHYRKGASLDRVLATLEALVERRRATASTLRLQVNMVEYPELHDHVDEFVAHFRQRVDEVMVSRYRPLRSRRFSPIQLPRVPCYQLDTLLPMGPDGRVAMCCEDPQGQHLVGWFPAQSLSEIWRGAAWERLRRMHADSRWDELSPCRDCDAWSAVYERRSERGGLVVQERTPGTTWRTDAAGVDP
jgi:pyruvate-formate lyase-activating enzyme